MFALDPDFARMSVPARIGVAALCLGGGAALGLLGTFAHQSLPPVGVSIALITVALYVGGLRAWGGVRTPAAAGVVGVGLVSGLLATATGASVLVPANAVGYAWPVGITAIAFVALAWPHIQRPRIQQAHIQQTRIQQPHRLLTDTIESSTTVLTVAPEAMPELKDRPLP